MTLIFKSSHPARVVRVASVSLYRNFSKKILYGGKAYNPYNHYNPYNPYNPYRPLPVGSPLFPPINPRQSWPEIAAQPPDNQSDGRQLKCGNNRSFLFMLRACCIANDATRRCGVFWRQISDASVGVLPRPAGA